MNFPTSVLCNEAGQEVLKQKVRHAVNSLNRDWNFCSNSFEGKFFRRKSNVRIVIDVCYNKMTVHIAGTRECRDLNINVQCDHRARIARQASTEDDAGTYTISVDVLAEP